jgi:GAF domain
LLNELKQSLEQQTATTDVLKVISRSAFDLQAVLETLVQAVARLCEADKSVIMQRDGDVYRTVAHFGFAPELVQWSAEHPLPGDRASATGRAALEGRPIHIPDVLADPEYGASGHQRAAGHRTTLAVPLLREGMTIDVFGLLREEVRPFTEIQIELVQSFADQAVIAIENARLLNELRQRTTDLSESLEQQTATAEVLHVISSSPVEVEQVFAVMLEKAVRICDAAFGNIFSWDGNALQHVAGHNTPPAFAEARRRLPLGPYSRKCFRARDKHKSCGPHCRSRSRARIRRTKHSWIGGRRRTWGDTNAVGCSPVEGK